MMFRHLMAEAHTALLQQYFTDYEPSKAKQPELLMATNFSWQSELYVSYYILYVFL